MYVWFLLEKYKFFPTRTKFFCQEPINEVFFWEETLLSSQDDIHLSRISFLKQAHQKNYSSSLKTQYLFGKNVSFWVSPQELSFTQEWIFVFKLIVLHKRLTLLVWRITFKSILADKVFVLCWGLNILLRRIFCLYWVLLSYWKDWFSSNAVNYTEKNLIFFGFIFWHVINITN